MCCVFCKVELKEWKPEDCLFKEHKRGSPACLFINKLNVGNKPVASYNEEMIRSRDVCGSSIGKHFWLHLFCYICMSFIFPSLIFSMFFTAIEPTEQKPRGQCWNRMETFKQYPCSISAQVFEQMSMEVRHPHTVKETFLQAKIRGAPRFQRCHVLCIL